MVAPGSAVGTKGVLASDLTNWNTGLIPSSFFRGTNGETTTIPKAYINYIFMDEQFKYAGGDFSRVGSSGVVKDHWTADARLQDITVPKNGYIFVYVSNESNLDVFFDNLQVIHKPGPILEETHYYPFGLTMAGISSKALNFGTPGKGNSRSNKKKSGSDSGSSDSPGSHGGKKRAADFKKTDVRNYEVADQGTNHGNIDEKTENLINWLIKTTRQNRQQ